MEDVKITYPSSSITEAYLATMVQEFMKDVQIWDYRHTNILSSFGELDTFLLKQFPKLKRIQRKGDTTYIDVENKCFFEVYHFSDDEFTTGSTGVHIRGASEPTKMYQTIIDDTFPKNNQIEVTWAYFMTDGRLYKKKIPFESRNTPENEMYPFLKEPLADYYNKYLAHESPILILLGEPGTGKTSFIRGLIAQTKIKTIISYDNRILDNDEFFIEFLTGDSDLLVIEDSDILLSKRENGNNMMRRFLNVSDGLLKFPNKKIIFTTNLSSINYVDEALMRKGRCFDTLNFRKLTTKEAMIIATKHKLSLPVGTEFTIADIFCSSNNMEEHNVVKQNFGFVGK